MKKTPFLFYILMLVIASTASNCASNDSSYVGPANGTSGTGGSTARFTISGDDLFIVDKSSLRRFDISQPANPQTGAIIPLNVVVETIFPYGKNLFIGTQTGMYIFDISNPVSPKQLSVFTHMVACDPVVVQGNYAYVTLRSGTTCNRAINSLDIVDISDLTKPKLIQSYPMQNPHGLGIINNNLFVCEGDFGMKTFQVNLENNAFKSIQQKSFLQSPKTFDVIPLPQSLLVTGKDGFYQYDYQNLTNLKLLSTIPVSQ